MDIIAVAPAHSSLDAQNRSKPDHDSFMQFKPLDLGHKKINLCTNGIFLLYFL
jgi:hypothetical protein